MFSHNNVRNNKIAVGYASELTCIIVLAVSSVESHNMQN